MAKGMWLVRYTVYNNKTDMPVIVDGTAEEAMMAMDLTSLASFYSTVSRVNHGTCHKWHIIKTKRKEYDFDDQTE